jgi:hypothetical protein
MFEKTMAEARYLRAAAALNEDFELALAEFLDNHAHRAPGAELARIFIDNYLDTLFKEF